MSGDAQAPLLRALALGRCEAIWEGSDAGSRAEGHHSALRLFGPISMSRATCNWPWSARGSAPSKRGIDVGVEAGLRTWPTRVRSKALIRRRAETSTSYWMRGAGGGGVVPVRVELVALAPQQNPIRS